MKTYIETILDDLDLINDVTVDYSTGRNRGLTDDETEEKAYKVLSKAVNLIDELKEVVDSRHVKDLEDFMKCCIAFRNDEGKCKGYQLSRWNKDIADRCKECKEFEGSCFYE